MKTKLLIIIFLVLAYNSVNSQTSDKITGFSDIKLSYNISSMSAGGDHFKKDETIIPFGVGLELNYILGKRYSIILGIEFRTTGQRIEDSYIYSWFGYSGPIHHESKDVFFDIPIHFNYAILNTKPFNINITTGPKGTIEHLNDYYNPGYDGKENRFKGYSFSVGLDIGLIQWVQISRKIGIFTSQQYEYYIIGPLSDLETIDLKIGLTYNFK